MSGGDQTTRSPSAGHNQRHPQRAKTAWAREHGHDSALTMDTRWTVLAVFSFFGESARHGYHWRSWRGAEMYSGEREPSAQEKLPWNATH